MFFSLIINDEVGVFLTFFILIFSLIYVITIFFQCDLLIIQNSLFFVNEIFIVFKLLFFILGLIDGLLLIIKVAHLIV